MPRETEPRQRSPLTRARVLRAAVELADEVGLDAVSMRRLAGQLGVVPMALYKHVADKEELLDSMVDAVIREIDPADPGLDWKDAIRARILSARRTILRHPWARQAIETRTRRTPDVLDYLDSTAGMFRAGGLSADLTHHVMHALGNRIWGFSPELFNPPPATSAPDQAAPEDAERRVSDDAEQREGAPAETALADAAMRYPHIMEIAMAATGGDLSAVGRGCDEQFEFEFALDLLLDGAERLQRSGWTSHRSTTPSRVPPAVERVRPAPSAPG